MRQPSYDILVRLADLYRVSTATCGKEALFLFKLSDFELFVNSGKIKGSYLPFDWRDYFGVPVEEHEEAYKVDLAAGYVTTDQA